MFSNINEAITNSPRLYDLRVKDNCDRYRMGGIVEQKNWLHSMFNEYGWEGLLFIANNNPSIFQIAYIKAAMDWNGGVRTTALPNYKTIYRVYATICKRRNVLDEVNNFILRDENGYDHDVPKGSCSKQLLDQLIKEGA